MLIGVPNEIKSQECRVGLVATGVRELISHGHEVWVEAHAGGGIGFTDDDYQKVGAKIVDNPETIFAKADMIIKVKEPQGDELKRLRDGQIIFTYLHLAADPEQAEGLKASGCTAIAYETVTDEDGQLPLLSPMSEIAGRLSIVVGAYFLQEPQGGCGILLGGAPGVDPGNIVVIGGGVVGTNAARMGMGKEAHVTVLEKSLPRLKALDVEFGSKLNTIFATEASIEEHVLEADLLIGAVLVPGAAAPKVISRELVRQMRVGSVIVDVAIDQGGCIETSRPTTHKEPTFIEEGVVHYCVTNMPGAVPRTATFALNNATLPFVLALADKGAEQAMRDDPHLCHGLNVYQGKITHEAVAKGLNEKYVSALDAIKKT